MHFSSIVTYCYRVSKDSFKFLATNCWPRFPLVWKVDYPRRMTLLGTRCAPDMCTRLLGQDCRRTNYRRHRSGYSRAGRRQTVVRLLETVTVACIRRITRCGRLYPPCGRRSLLLGSNRLSNLHGKQRKYSGNAERRARCGEAATSISIRSGY
ncbi:hypothetical protein K439DRAFT_968037 [Ramaria rubella]|nr:hypothetical protein K439DRAFT_968037 [Ramaria rubella]